MNTALSRLFDVLEEEIAVGEELSRNLAAQKHAIIGWDIAGLLQAIDAIPSQNWRKNAVKSSKSSAYRTSR